MIRERFLRLLDAAEYLANHIHKAPVWIVPCLEGATPTRTSGSSIYPAVQNMLLAARALGLGATLTTLYLNFEKEVEAALGLPPNVHSYALLRSNLARSLRCRFVPTRSAQHSRERGQWRAEARHWTTRAARRRAACSNMASTIGEPPVDGPGHCATHVTFSVDLVLDSKRQV